MQYENSAYVSRATGKVYWVSNEFEDDETLPGDIDDGTLYIAVPHKSDLQLGRNLVFEFVEAHFPDEINRVHSFFSRRGAYSRFKDFLEYKNRLKQWYEFENNAIERALHQWANDNGFELSARTRNVGG